MRRVDAGVVADRLADADEGRRYAWLLGAGASRSSGAALASEILRDVKRQLYEIAHGTPASDDDEIERWLQRRGRLQDPDTAYGDALECLLPRPQQRRGFLYKYLESATPSSGYLGLAELARRRLWRLGLTTNFDDLVRQAMEQGDQRIRLREVAHDVAAADIEWPPEQPTLLKLHGDFLFDSIRNTTAELAGLASNQSERLRRAASDGGLVVVGYRGADASVMSVLEALSDVPLGLYWLHLPGEALHPRVEQLLANEWAFVVQTESFDEFVALVVERATVKRRAPSVVPGRLATTLGDPRFIVGATVYELSARVDLALRSPAENVCAITGLPGMGKTALALNAADRARNSFSSVVVLTAQRRELDLADLLDTGLRELSLGATADLAQARQRVLLELATRPVLLVLDNLDRVSAEVAALLRDLPSPSHALVTVRDPAGLRKAAVVFREVRHEGLSTDELREILRAHAEASPRIEDRLKALGDIEVEQLLATIDGWPQALMLVIGRLDTPVADVGSAERLTSGGDLVDRLLREGHADLTPDARSALDAAAAFGATITPEGAAAVARMSRSRAEAALTELLERRWLAELGSRTYTFAHPLVERFARSLRDRGRQGRRERALRHLEAWLERYGGQPAPDWSNFRMLDREAENVRAALEDALHEGVIKRMTDLMQPAFSYLVERGQWTATDRLAQRALAHNPSARLRAEWLIWRSWLALYLLEDPAESARLATAALDTGTRRVRPRFEAHRRALAALTRVGDFGAARNHADHAETLRPRLGTRDSDPAIDLLNAIAALDVAEGADSDDEAMIRRGLDGYVEAYDRCNERLHPNTRELGVAVIGQARAHQALGELDTALDLAQRAAADASAIGWLRGQEEAHRMTAEIADALGRPDLARSALVVAASTGRQLRSAA
jgi:tetratricopeptide (TPR) repeat protein